MATSLSSVDLYSKVFHPEVENVDEFLQRFKLQNSIALNAAKSDKNPNNCATILANALPINILTDIQRRLKPKLLTDATYEELEKHLINSFNKEINRCSSTICKP